MCPIASLFDLIEDPCKSMWNSSEEVQFSFDFICKCSKFSTIVFNLQNTARFGYFYFKFTMAGLDTGGEQFDVPEICVVGNPTTWKLDLPPNHGKLIIFFQ